MSTEYELELKQNQLSLDPGPAVLQLEKQRQGRGRNVKRRRGGGRRLFKLLQSVDTNVPDSQFRVWRLHIKDVSLESWLTLCKQNNWESLWSTAVDSIKRTKQETEKEREGRGEREEWMLVNYRRAWQLNRPICAELRPVGHHRTGTHTHTPPPPAHTGIHRKLSPQGVVIKAFKGIVIEG